MPFPNCSDLELLLANLIHDLRQPLSNIQTSTYRLAALIESCDVRVKDQVRMVERQVEDAERLLSATVAELGRLRSQRHEDALSMELTNSTRAGVT